MAQINGSDGDDSLAGTAADDVMLGGAGDDVLRSSAGGDTIDGGAGFDTYVINVGRSGLVATSPADGVFVIEPTAGGLGGSFGIDTVVGVESFRIVASGGTVTLSGGEMLARFGGDALGDGEAARLAPVKAFADEHEARATRLYDTVFDRAPDRPGLDFWSSALRQGHSLDTIADEFIVAPEFRARYGTPDSREFVGQLYRNVLDREGEAGGVDFWTDVLDRGLADRSDVVQAFSEAPEHVAKVTADDYLP